LGASARSCIAVGLADIGNFDEAAREAAPLLVNPVMSTVEAVALAALALVALHRDEPADSLALVERGLRTATSGQRILPTESLLHLVRAEALHALGRTPDAHAAIREARDRVLGIGATLEPDDRMSWLTNVNPNARTLALAKEWLGE
jgi:hypothetical protein